MSKQIKIIFGIVIAILVISGVCAGIAYYYLLAPQFFPEKTVYLYIDRDDTVDSIYNKVETVGHVRNLRGFKWQAEYREYGKHIHTGRYAIRPKENTYHVFSRLLRGYQEPARLIIGSVRTAERLAHSVGRQLMIDSTEVAMLMNDTAFLSRLGYSRETLPTLFIPNTYEVYWNISAEAFFERMQKEYNRFWNNERRTKAEKLKMTPTEVSTLASIVEEETNNNAEKPLVAGLYLNRLRIGMPLQADPTVKFALQDFGLKRILNKHLSVESPYNTYIYRGLPPGPIRIPTPTGIDAVLNHTKHDYLYMCAKEDFSGTHNFAATLAEHNRNARKYQNALNKRKIFK